MLCVYERRRGCRLRAEEEDGPSASEKRGNNEVVPERKKKRSSSSSKKRKRDSCTAHEKSRTAARRRVTKGGKRGRLAHRCRERKGERNSSRIITKAPCKPNYISRRRPARRREGRQSGLVPKRRTSLAGGNTGRMLIRRKGRDKDVVGPRTEEGEDRTSAMPQKR